MSTVTLLGVALALPLAAVGAQAAEKTRAGRPAVTKTETAEKARKTPAPISEAGAAAVPAGAKDGGKETNKDGNKKARVYTFSGLDVEGKLKTPQLLYFRSRVKQELDTSTPEKKSFMKELEQSADAPGL